MYFSSTLYITYLKKDQALIVLKLVYLYVMFVNTQYIIFIKMFYKLVYER